MDLLLQRRHFEARAWGGKVAKLQNCLRQNILLRMLLRFNGTLQIWPIGIHKFPKITQLENLFQTSRKIVHIPALAEFNSSDISTGKDDYLVHFF